MQPSSLSMTRVLGTAAVAVVCLLAIPLASQARDHDGDDEGRCRQESKHHKKHHQDNCNPVNRGIPAPPIPGFILSLVNGNAGRGYYARPRNTSCYEQRREVRYYGYERARSNSLEAAVQLALARNGYYNGPIDGDLGPRSRRAIANYQEDRGLRVTGYPNSSLLNSLGL
jgi:hypothetical protein